MTSQSSDFLDDLDSCFRVEFKVPGSHGQLFHDTPGGLLVLVVGLPEVGLRSDREVTRVILARG